MSTKHSDSTGRLLSRAEYLQRISEELRERYAAEQSLRVTIYEASIEVTHQSEELLAQIDRIKRARRSSSVS